MVKGTYGYDIMIRDFTLMKEVRLFNFWQRRGVVQFKY